MSGDYQLLELDAQDSRETQAKEKRRSLPSLKAKLSNFFTPEPVDEIGHMKSKLRLGYYVTLTCAVVILSIVAFLISYASYPLILTSQQLIDFDEQLPFFRICVDEGTFLGDFMGAALIAFDPLVVNRTQDCRYADIFNDVKSYKGNGNLCQVSWFVTLPSTYHCIYLMPNLSHWTLRDNDNTLTLVGVIKLNTSVAPSVKVDSWSFSRLLSFAWIPPDTLNETMTEQDNDSIVPECNEIFLGVNGLSILVFNIEVYEHFNETCYVTVSSFLPYSKRDLQRLCEFVNERLNSTINCSSVSSDTYDNITFFQLRLSLESLYVQYLRDEQINSFLVRTLSMIGGIVSLLPPLLWVIFSWFLTRVIFWKQRDAYYSDEIREAVTYFLHKERLREHSSPD
jgi:hypothetical protein